MFGWGVVVTGGFVYHWLRFLDRVFPPAGQTVQRVFTKIAVNQALMSPGLNGAFFGVSTARSNDLLAAAGREQWLRDWRAKINKDLLDTVIQSNCLWCPAHVVNFYFVPPQHRVLFTSGIFFAWTSWLSMVGYRKDI